jgi:hypothetical protein
VALDGARPEHAVSTAGRFVVVAGPIDVTVIDSPDGMIWHRQPPFVPTAWTLGPGDIAAGSAGILGWGGGEGGAIGFWQSADGLAWTLVPNQPSLQLRDHAFGGVQAAVETNEGGWLAVGGEYLNSVPTPGLLRGVALTSPDGLAWTRSPDSPALRHAVVNGIIGYRGGYLAVGTAVADPSRNGSGLRAGLWFSPDGRTWVSEDVVPAFDVPDAVPGGPPSSVALEGIVSKGTRLVVLGWASWGTATTAQCRALVWWSDGGDWAPVELGPCGGAGNPSLGVAAGRFMVTGLTTAACPSGLWSSPDAVAWTCLGNHDPTFDGFVVTGAADALDRGLLVGYREAGNDRVAGASWTMANR